jgi:hypothetical protein
MEAKIILENPPTNCYTGKIHILPDGSSTKAYMKLGNEWVLLADATYTYDIFNTTNNLILTIDSIDKTSILQMESLYITDVLTSEVNTCEFSIFDSTQTFIPKKGQEIVVYRKTTGDFEIEFGGIIIDINQEQIAPYSYQYRITCNDYSECLKKRLVVETYENMTIEEIIYDIVTNYAKDIGTYFVESGTLIDKYQFNYKYPFDCLVELAGIMNWSWYVDYERNIHFFPLNTNTAPYSITDDKDDCKYRNLTIRYDHTQTRNDLIVRGGWYLSELYTQENVADGTQLAFNLNYQAYEPVSVYVNSGAGYVAKTLGIDNIDESGKDFVYNFTEKVIKNLDHIKLTAGHKIKITYKYKIPVLIQQPDNASIDDNIQNEGGDGHHEYIIIDDKLQSQLIALKRAVAEINTYSYGITDGSFTTIQNGFRSGQLLTINIPTRDINEQFLIQEVSTTSHGNGLFEYEIRFANKLIALERFLMDLFDISRPKFERTDEVLAKLSYVQDSLLIGEEITDTDLRDTSIKPFTYGADINEGRYELASYA